MTHDPLEEFVKKNRQAFDVLQPPDEAWEHIARHLNERDNKQVWNIWRIAAVFFFLATMALLTARFWQPAGQPEMALSPEIQEAERYYNDQITGQRQLLTSYLEIHPELAQEFLRDLDELQANYKQLKNEYNQTGSEAVLAAMIRNLQLQQELLSEQLNLLMNLNNPHDDTISL